MTTASERFHDGYRELFETMPAAERDALVADWKVLTLPGTLPPWTESGITVHPGEQITVLASGKVYLSEELGIWGPPRFHLWARIGDRGTIFNGPRDTFTRKVESDGTLQLAILQGQWATPEGELLTPVEAYEGGGGSLDVLVIRWKGDARRGLQALARFCPTDQLIVGELARLDAPVRPPKGWHYLWFLGESEIFAATEVGGKPAIRATPEGDVGILQKPIAMDLAADTTLSWRWKVSQLPATEAENTMPTHDYLSIAAEFENGLDLTWYWSAKLPVETHFACPLPTWTARETHYVVRSGPAGLGEWQTETRNVLADYGRAIGGTPPKRIVAVWLIAVALFRHGKGVAEFANVSVGNGGNRLTVV